MNMMRIGDVYEVNNGITYEPWTNGDAIGFKITHANGNVEYVYLSPAIGDTDEYGVTVYHDANEPSYDNVLSRHLVHVGATLGCSVCGENTNTGTLRAADVVQDDDVPHAVGCPLGDGFTGMTEQAARDIMWARIEELGEKGTSRAGFWTLADLDAYTVVRLPEDLVSGGIVHATAGAGVLARITGGMAAVLSMVDGRTVAVPTESLTDPT